MLRDVGFANKVKLIPDHKDPHFTQLHQKKGQLHLALSRWIGSLSYPLLLAMNPSMRNLLMVSSGCKVVLDSRGQGGGEQQGRGLEENKWQWRKELPICGGGGRSQWLYEVWRKIEIDQFCAVHRWTV